MIYVDDEIIGGMDSAGIYSLITILGIAKNKQRHVFELRDEGNLLLLDMCIEKSGRKNFTLSQTKLIARVLREANLVSCNAAQISCSTVSLRKDEHCENFHEFWEYDIV